MILTQKLRCVYFEKDAIFSKEIGRIPCQMSISGKILKSLRLRGRGFAFTVKDFVHLGARGAVDWAIGSLLDAGHIRRIRRGLYDYPRHDDRLGGALSPDLDQVAQALARRFGVRIQPHGAWAANVLGLSTQVPAKVTYLTDGKTRSFDVGKQTIDFKHVEPGKLPSRGDLLGLIASALRSLGPAGVDAAVLAQLRSLLADRDPQRLVQDAKFLETWILDIIKEVASP